MERSEHVFGNVIKMRQYSGKCLFTGTKRAKHGSDFGDHEPSSPVKSVSLPSYPLSDLDLTRSGSLEVKAERPKQRVKAEEQDKTVVVINSDAEDISTPQTRRGPPPTKYIPNWGVTLLASKRARRTKSSPPPIMRRSARLAWADAFSGGFG